jgi:short-subunit dehydrogenase involved in D-alanine esterification of teichoic acids
LQQHLPKFNMAMILLKAKSNRVSDLVTLSPELLQAIPSTPEGAVTTVGSGIAHWAFDRYPCYSHLESM